MKTKRLFILAAIICIASLFSVDLTYAYHPVSPYAFCNGNPIRYVDPNGMDVYRYDDKTGEMILFEKTEDNFDRIGKFKYDKKTDTYTLKTNKQGEARTRMDNIEKGILSDGMNFMVNDNSWAVGEKGQPTVAGFQDFAVGFAEMINKEVSGYYLSNPQAPNTVNTIYMGRHVNNTATKSHKGSLWGHLPNMQFNMQVHTDWHTHPTYGHSDADRTRPSGLYDGSGDIKSKNVALGQPHPYNRPLKFMILTRGYAPIYY